VEWFVNGTSISTSPAPIIPFPNPVSNTVQLVATDTLTACSDTSNANITVNPLPNIFLGNDTVICAGQTLQLDASLPNASYLWSDNSTNSTLLVNQSGTYWVDVITNGCTGRDSINVVVSPSPNSFLGNDTSICDRDTLVLDATILGATYIWQDNSRNPTFDVSQAGVYSVTVSVNNCTFNDSIDVTVSPIPSVNLGVDQSVCEGDLIVLDATFPGATYIWQDGTVNPTFNVTQTGTYFVDVNLNGCIVSDTVNATVNPFPNVSLGTDDTICADQDLVLNATNLGATYLWQDGSVAPTFTVTQPGTYSVVVAIGQCESTDTISVTVNNLPEVNLGNDTAICEGEESFLLEVSVIDGTYLWQDGSINSSFTVNEGGDYAVTVTENNCSASDSVNVTAIKPPEVDLGNDTTVCDTEEFILDLSSIDNATYLWQDNSTSSNYLVTESEMISVEVTQEGCSPVRDSIEVLLEVCECDVWLPNSFTPNGDGLNDSFGPIYNCNFDRYSFLIYDRYGQLIYESVTPGEFWDGRINGIEAPNAVFVYRMVYAANRELNTLIGKVVLVR